MHASANDSPRAPWTPLVAYFAVAFAITWLSIIAFVASRSFRLDTITVNDGLVLFGFMLLGPIIAGLVMTAALGDARAFESCGLASGVGARRRRCG